MSRAPSSEGLRSEAMRAALASALAGKPGPLEDLLRRHGDGHGARPNLRLAAAFGAEMAALPGNAVAPAGSAGRERRRARHARRVPSHRRRTRVGGTVARRSRRRTGLGGAGDAGGRRTDARPPGHAGRAGVVRRGVQVAADALLARAIDWLELDDREIRFGAAGVVVEVFADRQTLAALADPEALLDYLSRAIAAVAGAPRAAERSDARRRLLLALPRTLAAVAAGLRGGDRGAAWLEEECRSARHPDVRGALSKTILILADKSSGQGAALAQGLRAALEGSAKPPRDPTRNRPGRRPRSNRRARCADSAARSYFGGGASGLGWPRLRRHVLRQRRQLRQIGQQDDLDAAVLAATLGRGVLGYRVVLAVARRHDVLGLHLGFDQEARHDQRPRHRELPVVLVRLLDRLIVGVARDHEPAVRELLAG